MTAWPSGLLPISGGQIAYHRTGGDGPALVLSHGLTDNRLCWSRLAAALSPDFDVIMLDARGHGGSSRMIPGELHDPAADVAEAIEALGLTRPIVMGHSVGARSTARYADTWPDRVARVILKDPPLLPLPDPAAVQRRRIRFREQIAKLQAMAASSRQSWRPRRSTLIRTSDRSRFQRPATTRAVRISTPIWRRFGRFWRRPRAGPFPLKSSDPVSTSGGHDLAERPLYAQSAPPYRP